MNINLTIKRGHIQIPVIGVDAELEDLTVGIENASSEEILALFAHFRTISDTEPQEEQEAEAGVESFFDDLMKNSPFGVPNPHAFKAMMKEQKPDLEGLLKNLGVPIFKSKGGPFGPFGPYDK